MAETQEGENRSEEAPQKSGGGMMKEILIYVGAMFVMTIIAVVMVTVLFKSDTEGDTTVPEPPESIEGSEDPEALSKDDPVFTFDPPIIVNTNDPEATRILSVKIHVVFRKSDLKSQLENSDVLQYQMRDLFITTFSTRMASELQDTDIKKELKAFLKKEINDRLGAGSVKQVYFSEYIIQ